MTITPAQLGYLLEGIDWRLAAESDRRVLDIEIERLKLEIARLKHERYGQSAERGAGIEQLELSLEDLEETAAAIEAAAVSDPAPPQASAPPAAPIICPASAWSSRRPHPVPAAAANCPSWARTSPRRWSASRPGGGSFSMCARNSPAAAAPPSPSRRRRSTPSRAAGPASGCWPRWCSTNSACICRCTARAAVSRLKGWRSTSSTLVDWVGAVSVALRPLVAAIADHARAGPRVHVDDTPVPVLAKGKTRTGRLWTMVRDDGPFGGNDPPAAAYAYSPDRGGEHAKTLLAGFSGIMQADAFSVFNRLYEKGAIVEAACWAHGRRKFYELAQLKKAPIAIEAVARIDALFAIERDIAGLSPDERLAARTKRSRPLADDLAPWLHHKRAGLSGKADTAKAMDYLLKRWPAFTLFLTDGRVDLSNNAAERALRGIAVGHRN